MTERTDQEREFANRSRQASAAAARREIAGGEWDSHATQRAGVRSARFCAASLFIELIKGCTLRIDSNAYRSACRSLKREYAFIAGISSSDNTVDSNTSSGKFEKSESVSNMPQRSIARCRT